MKKFICCFLSVMLLMGCSVFTFAVSNNQESVWNEENYSPVKGTELQNDSQAEYYMAMEDQIIALYQNHSGYRVYTVGGEDITDTFLSENLEYYIAGQYDLIANALCRDVLTIAEPTEYSPCILSADGSGTSIQGYTVGVTVKKRYTTNFGLGIKKFYVTYDIYGSYKVNDSTFKIVSVTSGPTMSKSTVVASNIFSDADADFNFGNANFNHTITSGNTSVRFYGSFVIRAVSNAVVGLYQDTPVSFSFYGYGNGNVS